MNHLAIFFGMAYRVDIASPPPEAFDVLVELGALDVETVGNGLAAILPEEVTKDMLRAALGTVDVTVSDAVARDAASVWLLSQRPVRIGSVLIGSPEMPEESKALRLTDSRAFGTGHHPTTALCIEALEEILSVERIESVLDVGTGSGILSLAALVMGVPRAIGLDIDANALDVAAQNARLNNLADRLQLILGGPDTADGTWPLVIANVLGAPLIDMASTLVRRVGKGGWLILSGIASSLEFEVRQVYQHRGMRHIGARRRGGWSVLIEQASW